VASKFKSIVPRNKLQLRAEIAA